MDTLQSSLFFEPSNLNVFPLIPAVGIVFRKYQVFLAHELKEYNIFPADVPFLFGALMYCTPKVGQKIWSVVYGIIKGRKIINLSDTLLSFKAILSLILP